MAKQTDRAEVEAVARAIYWEMNSVMHDHNKLWRGTDNKVVYRDCARAAIQALDEHRAKGGGNG